MCRRVSSGSVSIVTWNRPPSEKSSMVPWCACSAVDELSEWSSTRSSMRIDELKKLRDDHEAMLGVVGRPVDGQAFRILRIHYGAPNRHYYCSVSHHASSSTADFRQNDFTKTGVCSYMWCYLILVACEHLFLWGTVSQIIMETAPRNFF